MKPSSSNVKDGVAVLTAEDAATIVGETVEGILVRRAVAQIGVDNGAKEVVRMSQGPRKAEVNTGGTKAMLAISGKGPKSMPGLHSWDATKRSNVADEADDGGLRCCGDLKVTKRLWLCSVNEKIAER